MKGGTLTAGQKLPPAPPKETMERNYQFRDRRILHSLQSVVSYIRTMFIPKQNQLSACVFSVVIFLAFSLGCGDSGNIAGKYTAQVVPDEQTPNRPPVQRPHGRFLVKLTSLNT